MKVFNLSLLACFLLVGCLNKNSPEYSLKSFISYRFSEGQTRDGILEKTAGSLNEKVAKMSEEELKGFISVKNFKKKYVKILTKKIHGEDKCYITYIVSYDTLKNDKTVFSSDVKKIAELLKIDGDWKISDVNNIKTFHNSHQEIEI